MNSRGVMEGRIKMIRIKRAGDTKFRRFPMTRWERFLRFLGIGDFTK